jgi:alpha-L-fucosidase
MLCNYKKQIIARSKLRSQWHTNARFGVIIHWGAYSAIQDRLGITAGRTGLEHFMRLAEFSNADYYDSVIQAFDPNLFNAKELVDNVKRVGAQYVIFTVKHHDGLAMFASVVRPNIKDTKLAKDPVEEIVRHCRQSGIRVGFYYSHSIDWSNKDAPGNDWEWSNPGGSKRLGGGEWWAHKRSDFVSNLEMYFESKVYVQIKELIRMYKPDIFWFSNSELIPAQYNLKLLDVIRSEDPDVCVSESLSAEYGDYISAANHQIEFIPYKKVWETVVTTNNSYGWSQYDMSHKSPEYFTRTLARIVSKGGNMLLNIGLDGAGAVATRDQFILNEIATWIETNGESILDCEASQLPVQIWGVCTVKKNVIYLHILSWPEDSIITVEGLKSDPVDVKLLGSSCSLLNHRVTDNSFSIEIDNQKRNSHCVVKLEFEQCPESNNFRLLGAKLTTILHVFDGNLVGRCIRFGNGRNLCDTVVGWTNTSCGVDWFVRTEKALSYNVDLTYVSVSNAAGVLLIICGNSTISINVPTPECNCCREVKLVGCGVIALGSGEHLLRLRSAAIVGSEMIRVKSISFSPRS